MAKNEDTFTENFGRIFWRKKYQTNNKENILITFLSEYVADWIFWVTINQNLRHNHQFDSNRNLAISYSDLLRFFPREIWVGYDSTLQLCSHGLFCKVCWWHWEKVLLHPEKKEIYISFFYIYMYWDLCEIWPIFNDMSYYDYIFSQE